MKCDMDAGALEELPTSTTGLPPLAARHLESAGLAYAEAATAEAYLDEAQALAPEHLAVHVARYRYLFYKGRLEEALTQLAVCFEKASAQGGLPSDWRGATRGAYRFGDFEAPWPRFYMFALKAHGYLCLRLGRLEEGRAAASKALELDPEDKVGAKLLLEVLDRIGREDDD
jgi:tetratricopeptide (TPR) repeat protein